MCDGIGTTAFLYFSCNFIFLVCSQGLDEEFAICSMFNIPADHNISGEFMQQVQARVLRAKSWTYCLKLNLLTDVGEIFGGVHHLTVMVKRVRDSEGKVSPGDVVRLSLFLRPDDDARLKTKISNLEDMNPSNCVKDECDSIRVNFFVECSKSSVLLGENVEILSRWEFGEQSQILSRAGQMEEIDEPPQDSNILVGNSSRKQSKNVNGKIKKSNKRKSHWFNHPFPWVGDRIYIVPEFVLQYNQTHTERLRSYFGHENTRVTHNLGKDRLLFVYNKNIHILNRLREGASLPYFFKRAIQRIFTVKKRFLSFSQAQKQFEAELKHEKYKEECVDDSAREYRVNCYPREMESVLQKAALDTSKSFTFTDGTSRKDKNTDEFMQCDNLIYADGFFWLGVSQPKMRIGFEKQDEKPCAAYDKLVEAVNRYLHAGNRLGMVAKLRSYLDKGGICVDIGASPGGWSYAIIKDMGGKTVAAIDPAEYMHDLLKPMLKLSSESNDQEARVLALKNLSESGVKQVSPEIHHFRTTGDSFIADVVNHEMPICAYVCDVNDQPSNTVESFVNLCRTGLFHGFVCLTLKNTCGDLVTCAAFQSEEAAAIQRLEDCGVREIESIHLFTNKNEKTLCGWMPGNDEEFDLLSVEGCEKIQLQVEIDSEGETACSETG